VRPPTHSTVQYSTARSDHFPSSFHSAVSPSPWPHVLPSALAVRQLHAGRFGTESKVRPKETNAWENALDDLMRGIHRYAWMATWPPRRPFPFFVAR